MRLQTECLPVCLPVSAESPSNLALITLPALGHSISLQATSGSTQHQLAIQRLTAQRCSSKCSVAADLAILEFSKATGAAI